MGIPHLITHLRPYATSMTIDDHPSLSFSVNTTPNRRVIIDGPGLAYHVYCTYLAEPRSVAHPLTIASLHEQIGPAVIAWLDQLERCGIKIDRIYFDGVLPLAKQETRLSRLEAYRNQWSAYRSTYPNLDIFPRPEGADENHLNQGFKSVTAGGKSPSRPPIVRRAGLPAPAFLVPAALEAIQTNPRYAHITKVVPGEADAYCARRARNIGGMIFTGDSDLLVYDIGQAGCVVFFADITFGDQYQGSQQASSDVRNTRLICRCYWSAEIIRRLGLGESFGLASLAFELEQDSAVPFSNLLQRAKSRTSHHFPSLEFQDFLDKYRGSEDTPRLTETDGDPNSSAQVVLERLDPRVSELVWLCIDNAEHLKMYLPFLLDDPTRSSAWEAGVSFRILGYSILVTSLYSRKYIEEMGRRGQRITSSNIKLLDSTTIQTHIDYLIHLLQAFKNTFPDVSNQAFWTLFVIQEIIHTSILNNKPAPTQSAIENLLFLKHQCKQSADWNDVHLLAQIQAASYSLRILRQIAKVGLATSTTSSSFRRRLCQDLLTHLKRLPGLHAGHVFAEEDEGAAGKESPDWNRIMKFVYERLEDQADMVDEEGEVEEEEEEVVERDVIIQKTSTSLVLSSRKKNKRKKKRRKGTTADKNQSDSSNKGTAGSFIGSHQNIFTMLSTSSAG